MAYLPYWLRWAVGGGGGKRKEFKNNNNNKEKKNSNLLVAARFVSFLNQTSKDLVTYDLKDTK